MKRITITVQILMISILFSAGQTSSKAKISYGKEFKDRRFNFFTEMFHSDESGYYALSKNTMGFNKSRELFHFSEDLILLNSIELELEYQENELDFQFAKMINDKLYVFSTFQNNKTDKYYLFYHLVEPSNLQIPGDPNVIAEIDFKGFGKYDPGSFDVVTSRDSSKILVYYNLPYDKKENERFGMVVYDKNFVELWKKNVELQYTDELISLQYHQVDNEGNVHVVAKVFDEKARDSRKGKPNFKQVVLNYFNDNREGSAYVLELDQKFVTDLIITSATPDEVQCTGFYSNSGTQSIAGAFYATFNSLTNETIVQKVKEFDIHFLTEGKSKKGTKKATKKKSKGKDVEEKNIELRNLVVKNDGGLILLGEQYYMVLQTSKNSNGQLTSRIYYYFNDVIIVSFDKEGEVLWTDKVHKIQKAENKEIGMASYALIANTDKLGLLYQDNPRNRGKKSNLSVWSSVKNYDLVLQEIDKVGESEKSYLTNHKKSKLWLFPRNYVQANANELVFCGMNKKKKKLVKMQLTE